MSTDGKSAAQLYIEGMRGYYQNGLDVPLIAQLCKLHYISVREFAEIFGVSKSYAHQLMQHEKLPSLELGFKISRYFEISMEELFGWRLDDDGARRPLLVEIPGQKEPHRVNRESREYNVINLIDAQVSHLQNMRKQREEAKEALR
jgi:transcriptional regulator with XRE-family HTH domain